MVRLPVSTRHAISADTGTMLGVKYAAAAGKRIMNS